ncbi:hypothetical protein QJQ45_023006 [Haematococcus lacustris]|nr:hypothetical protein QJQ45_023006 [Haematococcus lacustris]
MCVTNMIILRICSCLALLLFMARKKRRTGVGGPGAVPEDPGFDIVDRDEAGQPDLTEAERRRKASGEARAARVRDNTFHARKAKLAHLTDHLPQALWDAFHDKAVRPRVKAISERGVIGSLLLGFLVRDLFTLHVADQLDAQGQPLTYTDTDIPVSAADIPNLSCRNLFLQLCRGLPGNGEGTQPSAAVAAVLAAHPDLCARLEAIPRHLSDSNMVDHVGKQLETAFSNILTLPLAGRLKKSVPLAGAKVLLGTNEHQRRFGVRGLVGGHLPAWSKRQCTYVRRMVCGLEVTWLVGEGGVVVTAAMQAEVALQRGLLGLGEGEKVDHDWVEDPANRGRLLRHAVHTTREMEAAMAAWQLDMVPWEQSQPTNLSTRPPRPPTPYALTPTSKCRARHIFIDTRGLYGLMSDAGMLGVLTEAGVTSEDKFRNGALPDPARPGHYIEGPPNSKSTRWHIFMGVDPGKTNMATVAHEERSADGSVVSVRHWIWLATVKTQLTALSHVSSKPSSLASYRRFADTVLATYEAMWAEVSKPRWANARFRLYCGKKRVVASFWAKVNMQAKKLWPDRILALAYGAAGLKGSGTVGCRGVPVSQMQKEAVKQFRPERVVLVDEFRTSRVSSADNTPSETLLRICSCLALLLFMARKKRRTGVGGPGAVPEDPGFDIVDRDEAGQPDLTEAERRRKASGEARAARVRDNTFHARKAKLAHLTDHLPQALWDAFHDKAVRPRVKAISERGVIGSLLLGFLVRDLFTLHVADQLDAQGQPLTYTDTDIPVSAADIPNLSCRNLFLQLCRGLPGNGEGTQPSAAVAAVLAAHPDLCARLEAIPRHLSDSNMVDHVGKQLETAFSNILTLPLAGRLKKSVSLAGAKVLLGTNEHQRRFGVRGLVGGHLPAWSKRQCTYVRRMVCGLEVTWLVGEGGVVVTAAMQAEVALQRGLLGLGEGEKVDHDWVEDPANRGRLLRHAVHTTREMEAAMAAWQLDMVPWEQSQPTNLSTRPPRPPTPYALTPTSKCRARHIFIDTRGLYGLMSDAGMLGVLTEAGVTSEDKFRNGALPDPARPGHYIEGPPNSKSTRWHIFMGVDPGKTNMATVAHEERSADGSVVSVRHWIWLATVKTQLTALSHVSSKPSSLASYRRFADTVLATYEAMWAEVSKPRWANARFRLYCGKKRVVASFWAKVNMQAKKLWPDRILALAYGAAGLKGSGTVGCRGVPVSQMQKEAVKQFRPERVVLVDEFRTSRPLLTALLLDMPRVPKQTRANRANGAKAKARHEAAQSMEQLTAAHATLTAAHAALNADLLSSREQYSQLREWHRSLLVSAGQRDQQWELDLLGFMQQVTQLEEAFLQELQGTQAQLTDTAAALEATQKDLAAARIELAHTKQQLTTTNIKLEQLRAQVAAANKGFSKDHKDKWNLMMRSRVSLPFLRSILSSQGTKQATQPACHPATQSTCLASPRNQERDTHTGGYTAEYILSRERLLCLPGVSAEQLGTLCTAVVGAVFPGADPGRQASATTHRRNHDLLQSYIHEAHTVWLRRSFAVHVQLDGCTIPAHGKVVLYRVTAAVRCFGPSPAAAAGSPSPAPAAAADSPNPAPALPQPSPSPAPAPLPTPPAPLPTPPGPLLTPPAPMPTARTPEVQEMPSPTPQLEVKARVVAVRKCPDSSSHPAVQQFVDVCRKQGVWGSLASITVDSAAGNIGRISGLAVSINALRRQQGLALIIFWPCVSHQIHNALHKAMTTWGKAEGWGRQGLQAQLALSIEQLCSLTKKHWDLLGLSVQHCAQPSEPSQSRWGSYVDACSSLTRVLKPVTAAVTGIMQRQGKAAPAWAGDLCSLSLDTDLICKLMVVAVVGQQLVMPDLGWVATEGGMHAFELARHVEQLLDNLLDASTQDAEERFPYIFQHAQGLFVAPAPLSRRSRCL